MLRALLGSLNIHLFWSTGLELTPQEDAFLLRAAIPLAGRSFPIYESVHERVSRPRYQKRLLNTLAELLPNGCIPILVTDAGFRRPWIKAVAAQAWYYVAHIRNRELYRSGGADWQPVNSLYARDFSSLKRSKQ